MTCTEGKGFTVRYLKSDGMESGQYWTLAPLRGEHRVAERLYLYKLKGNFVRPNKHI